MNLGWILAVYRVANKSFSISETEFVDEHRAMLIQRVASVMEIADILLSKKIITNEMYSAIQESPSSQEKMRTLYRFLDSGGRAVKPEFYKVLKEKEPFLVEDLESR